MELRPSRCHRNKAPRRPSAIKNQIEGFPRWRMLWHRYNSAGGLALIAVTAFLGQMPMQRVSMILMSRRRSRALNSVRRTDLRILCAYARSHHQASGHTCRKEGSQSSRM